MPAPKIYGRISAFALFVALPVAPQAQVAVAATEPPTESFAAVAPAGATDRTPIQMSSPAPAAEQRGSDLILERRYQAALDILRKIEHPSAAVWNQMGIAHQMLFDTRNAARCYREALRLDPGNSGALNNLATIEDARYNFSAGERLYRQALKVQPASARIFKNLGTNLLLQHKYRASADAYAQALALDAHIFESHSGPTAETPISVRDRGIDNYLRARSCARESLNGCAIDHLRKAFDEGSATREQVASDKDFEAVRQTPEYERLLAEQR